MFNNLYIKSDKKFSYGKLDIWDIWVWVISQEDWPVHISDPGWIFFLALPQKLCYFKRRWKWHRRSFGYEADPIFSKNMYMKSDVTAIDHSSDESLKSMMGTVEIWADLVKAHSGKEKVDETQKSEKRVWKRFFNRMWDHCPHFICFIRWDSSSVLLSEN